LGLGRTGVGGKRTEIERARERERERERERGVFKELKEFSFFADITS
jgi:hypothetical protein